MGFFPIQLLFVLVIINRYVLGRWLRRTRGARFDLTTDDFLPSVAIVIPLFNEGAGIHQTILSLLQQDYPMHLLEVVVVDDCSRDDSHAWACRAAEGRPNVRVLRNPTNLGKRRAITRAVRATQSEIVISVDSDVVADRRAVRELVRRFTSDDIAAVGGRTYISNANRHWLPRMIEVKFFFAQEWLKDLERTFATVMCLSGCLTAYRRQVLLDLEPILEHRAVCGVDIRYGEDRFLTRQIVKAGWRTLYTTDAFCFTAAPDTLAGYFSQQLRWRRSNLIDFFGSLSHVWRLPPLVGVHYLSQLVMLIAYPVVIFENVINGSLWEVVWAHLFVIAALGVVYAYSTRRLPPERRVSPASFLPLVALMPVTYALFTPLALFTLDSSSWETRGAAPSPEAGAGAREGEADVSATAH